MAVESEREMMVMVWKSLVVRRAERISVPIVPLAWKVYVVSKQPQVLSSKGTELTPTRATFWMWLEEVMVVF